MKAIVPYRQAELSNNVIDAEFRVVKDNRDYMIASRQLYRMAIALLALVVIGTVMTLFGMNEELLIAGFFVCLLIAELVIFGSDGGFDRAEYPGQW